MYISWTEINFFKLIEIDNQGHNGPELLLKIIASINQDPN